MKRLKPGDKARVIGNVSNHEFELKETVEIVEYLGNDDYDAKGENGETWSLEASELEPIEPVQEEESPWISIKETLPEYGKEVLWHMTDGNMYVDSLERTDPYKGLNCTHWMPLPAPPKSEIEELKRKA